MVLEIRERCPVRHNVLSKTAPTVGRRAQATENVHRTRSLGLVARRWGSPRTSGYATPLEPEAGFPLSCKRRRTRRWVVGSVRCLEVMVAKVNGLKELMCLGI